VFLRQCASGERWAGLWDFPRFGLQAESGPSLRRELQNSVLAMTGLKVRIGKKLTTIKHGVTRFRITLTCHRAKYQSGESTCETGRWVRPPDLVDYPLSVTGREISEKCLLDPPDVHSRASAIHADT
jgi:A/G-specific adenine glycosylase